MRRPRWRLDMETFSASFYPSERVIHRREGNPPVAGGFPSQRDSDAEKKVPGPPDSNYCKALKSLQHTNLTIGYRKMKSADTQSWLSVECRIHDDVIKWKQFPRHWPFERGIHRSPVNSPHRGQWRGALMFSLNCAWIHGWVNNRDAGDLRRNRAHYDVSVML